MNDNLMKYYCHKCRKSNLEYENPNYFDDKDTKAPNKQLNDLTINDLSKYNITRVITDCPCKVKNPCHERNLYCKDSNEQPPPVCDFMLIDDENGIEIYIELKNSRKEKDIIYALEEQILSTVKQYNDSKNKKNAIIIKTKDKVFNENLIKGDLYNITDFTFYGIPEDRIFLIPHKSNPSESGYKYSPTSRNVIASS